ncbi:nucleotide sugar epimerase [bacterium Unc6]|nr:nucleotide sugar epimerase [bacterium Unc6]
MKRILLTGCCGFIGWKTAQMLLEKGFFVFGIDNINNYYDIRLKNYRLNDIEKHKNLRFEKTDIEDSVCLNRILKKYRFDAVINLAARAGVRYSLKNPYVYFTTNSIGCLNLLECMRKFGIKKFVLASTSSLYAGLPVPFKECMEVNKPISPYAASKRSAETISYTYHYLYNIDVTILRYFTVYGPAGRPDMSIFRFIKLIDEDKKISVYGDGTQRRDWTYIDDIAEGTINGLKNLRYQIINLGNNNPVSLKYIIKNIEKYLCKKAKIDYKNFHKADMKITCACIKKAKKLLCWTPRVDIESGLKKTVDWYLKNKSFVSKIKL